MDFPQEANSRGPIIFSCNKCNIRTTSKKDYAIHLMTTKHTGIKKDKKEKKDTVTLTIKECKQFICPVCKKTYKFYSGLWKHRKTCIEAVNENVIINVEPKIPEADNKAILILVKELMQDNKEMKKQISDLCKTGITSIGNNNTINTTTNNTFNLQVFLNEQCKDAMNIGEFVDSFVIQLDELEHVGSVGYVDGISRIIASRLKDMDVYKRPFHCSDLKREIMYVKDQNKWEKEEKSNPKIRKAIKAVSHKNMVKVGDWRDRYPECRSNKSHLNDQFVKIIRQASGGVAEIADSEDKIMRRLAKEVGIDKT
jgi:hypothetical protein